MIKSRLFRMCVCVCKITCRFSQPFKIPSSSARILFPDKSNERNWCNGRNSAVEKMGFKESPNKLSDNFKMINVF